MIYKKYFAWLFVAAVVCVPLSLFAVVKYWQQRCQKLPVLSAPVQPSFSCFNQQGRAYSLSQWKGKIVVAHVFFTHCPVVCPKMMYGLKRVVAYANVPQLEVASFTVDPERDSVPQLKAYAQRAQVTGNWQLLTGDKRSIYLLARKALQLTATDGDGGPQDFIHSEKLVLLDRQGRIRGFYTGTSEEEVNNLIRDCRKLQGES